jgi:hypothetical protein
MPRKRRSPYRPGAGRSLWDTLYPTLDLHGYTAAEARVRAERWLQEQQSAGERLVRLITGRGMHSVGPPVLPTEVRALLQDLEKSIVIGFATEPGGGAFRVELRKPAIPPPLPTAPPRSAAKEDPALRREAEEALAELGIQATPELLAAEMKRLMRERGG